MKKLFLPFFLLIMAGCYYDSEEALFGKPGTGVCDTSITQFTAQVKPILNSYCLSCHSNASSSANGAGIRLQDYVDVKTYVSNGRLAGSIGHLTGFSSMPKGGGTLSSCDILIINAWITKGALND